VPVYLDDAADRDPAQGTLVLRGDTSRGYDVVVRRGAPLTLGEEALLPDPEPVVGIVSDLLTAPDPTTLDRLAADGVAYLFAPPPVDPVLAGTLDAVPGLSTTSAADTGGRAWRLDRPAELALPDPGAWSWLRPLLLVLQGLTFVVVVVLAAPTRRSDS
jgi:hypothetical protein